MEKILRDTKRKYPRRLRDVAQTLYAEGLRGWSAGLDVCLRSVPTAQPLVDAIELLRELDATERRALRDTTPSAFRPAH